MESEKPVKFKVVRATKKELYAQVEKLLKHRKNLLVYLEQTVAPETFDDLTDAELEKMVKNPKYDPFAKIKTLEYHRNYTEKVMEHVEKVIEFYMRESKSKTRPLRQKILRALYLDESHKPLTELAEESGISIYTLSDEWQKAKEELTVLIFGLNGLYKLKTIKTSEDEKEIDREFYTVMLQNLKLVKT